jgi:K+-transporting ATPase KdpF subunit
VRAFCCTHFVYRPGITVDRVTEVGYGSAGTWSDSGDVWFELRICGCVRPAEGGAGMILNVILLVLCALLMVYLLYALLRPEKF